MNTTTHLFKATRKNGTSFFFDAVNYKGAVKFLIQSNEHHEVTLLTDTITKKQFKFN